VTSSITGTSVGRAGGGANAFGTGVDGGASGPGISGTINTGGGGAAEKGNNTGGNGASGVVILKYPAAFTITIGAGLTGSTATEGTNKITTITNGTGNVSWAA
jgi:hypothetical protein